MPKTCNSRVLVVAELCQLVEDEMKIVDDLLDAYEHCCSDPRPQTHDLVVTHRVVVGENPDGTPVYELRQDRLDKLLCAANGARPAAPAGESYLMKLERLTDEFERHHECFRTRLEELKESLAEQTDGERAAPGIM